MKKKFIINPEEYNNCFICWNIQASGCPLEKSNYFIDKNDKENLARICEEHLKIIKIVDYKKNKLKNFQ